MFFLVILLFICVISGLATLKVYSDICKFVNKQVKRLAWKMNLDYKEMLDLFGVDISLNFKYFIPVFNYFNAMIEFGTMIINYDNFKDSIYEISPEFEYQESIEKEHDLKDNLEEKKEYFVGRTINGRVKNIYFDYDGKDFEIKDYSAKDYINLPNDKRYQELLKLLCEWYYGGYKYLNASNNISDVFNNQVANEVKNIYYSNCEYEVEFVSELTRKRK